jgi:ring-1,2-phenylacetyl-CoA epoxidase subunit PaaC
MNQQQNTEQMPTAINVSTYQLINLTLHLADSTLILSQRNSEWCGHGPVLEQDIAITNISLDLLGQARNFYQHAASLLGNDATEDSLAYLRTEREFKNLLLCELPRGDWAHTILRQYFFSQYQYLLFKKMIQSNDVQLAAIAVKSLKEVTYHLRWSSEWVLRLGDGTDESHRRLQEALTEIWPYTGEMFVPANYESEMASTGIGVDVTTIKDDWMKAVQQTLTEATLIENDMTKLLSVFMQSGGKTGVHTEHLGYILAEMQSLQRTYPGAEW